jgi:hypothetical protein
MKRLIAVLILSTLALTSCSDKEIIGNLKDKAQHKNLEAEDYEKITSGILVQAFVDPAEIDQSFKIISKPTIGVFDGVKSQDESDFFECLGDNAPKYDLTVPAKGDLYFMGVYGSESEQDLLFLTEIVGQGHGGDSDIVKDFEGMENSGEYRRCLQERMQTIVLGFVGGPKDNFVWKHFFLGPFENMNFGPRTKAWDIYGIAENGSSQDLYVQGRLINIVFNNIEGQYLLIKQTFKEDYLASLRNDPMAWDIEQNVLVANLALALESKLMEVQSK